MITITNPNLHFMNKLVTFYPNLLHNAEHYQFMVETKASIDAYTAEALGITSFVSKFAEALARENAALKVEKGSALSENAQKSDISRDRIWKSSDYRIKSALLSPLPDEVESAIVIKRIFDIYGDIRKHPNNKESAEMSNLVEDLLKPENAIHLKNVNLHRIIQEMKKQNDKYISIVSDRNVEVTSRDSGNVKAVRLEVDPVYDEIVETINATITLKLARPEVAKFVEEHNQRIKVYETTLHARETINKKDSLNKV